MYTNHLFTTASIFLLSLTLAPAADVHVGPVSTGTGNGSDWNNQAEWFTLTFVRGNTYYLADGIYPRREMDCPESGSTQVVIRKAINPERDPGRPDSGSYHGSDVGWNSPYGDGTALIDGPIDFNDGYWVIDGQVGGGPGSWKSGHGFKVDTELQGTGAEGFRCEKGNSDFEFRHIEVVGAGDDGDPGTRPNDAFSPRSNTLISHCYMHDMGRTIMILADSDNLVVEYCWCGKYESVSASHAEIASLKRSPKEGPGVENCTFRYNVFTWFEGTGGLVMHGDGFYLYGNVFRMNPEHYDSTTINHGMIGTWSIRAGLRNTKIFNNTFIGAPAAAVTFGLDKGDIFTGGHEIRNNLFYRARPATALNPSFGSAAHGHNHFIESLDANPVEATGTTGTGDPFTDWQNEGFELVSATPAGESLPAPYNIDMFGNVRGADGVWDRGAVEFGGVPDATPPAISSVSPANITSSGATITWATDEFSDSRVEFGTGTGYGSEQSLASLSKVHAVTLTGLNSSTQYHFRVHSTDPSGNAAMSGDFTFTTTVPDEQGPEIALTEPIPEVHTNMVTLAAEASDDTGVSGVLFLIDGQPVGAEITDPPYRMEWNSNLVPNGSYTVVARARDLEDNHGDSEPVDISIRNSEGGTAFVIGDWGFEGSDAGVALDASGNQNHGTASGVLRVAGPFGTAIQFDGVDDHVRIPSSPTMESTTGGITVAARVKVEANDRWQSVARKILQDGQHNFPYSAFDLLIEEQSGALVPRISVSDGTQRETVYSSTPLTAGQWHHLAATFDGSNVRIYVDGVVRGTGSFASTLVATDEVFYLGRNGLGGDRFKGALDEIRVYDRALTASEIAADAGSPPPNSPPSPPAGKRVLIR